MTGLVLVELDLVLAGEPSDRGVQVAVRQAQGMFQLLILLSLVTFA